MATGAYWCLLVATISHCQSSVIPREHSSAELLWGTALTWTTRFKLVPERPEIAAYIRRWNVRPSVAAVKAMDAELAAADS